MKPFTPKSPLIILLVTGVFPFTTLALAGDASPTPTIVVSKSEVQATQPVSVRPPAGKKDPISPILRKPTLKRRNTLSLEPLGLYVNPEFSHPLLDYDKLNADLYPILSGRPHTMTPNEKFWGTAAAVAGYSIAGTAAAQALGLLPSERIQKKK